MIPEIYKATGSYHWNNSFRGMVLRNQKVRRRYRRYTKYIKLCHTVGTVVLFALAFIVGWVCMAIF